MTTPTAEDVGESPEQVRTITPLASGADPRTERESALDGGCLRISVLAENSRANDSL
jgi:hypothetical protein